VGSNPQPDACEAFIGADLRAMPPELRAVLGQVFTFQRAVSSKPLVQLGFAEPKVVAFSRQRHAGNLPETCPLAQRLYVHSDIFSSLGGGEQVFRLRFNRRRVLYGVAQRQAWGDGGDDPLLHLSEVIFKLIVHIALER
jgi:hypothetical protein